MKKELSGIIFDLIYLRTLESGIVSKFVGDECKCIPIKGQTKSSTKGVVNLTFTCQVEILICLSFKFYEIAIYI